jgi:hypothetical protein
VATFAPGKHRRLAPEMQAPAGMPFSSPEFLQAPVVAQNEAAHLRAVILSLSEQLGQMSAYVTQNLESPGRLATTPAPAVTPVQTPAIAPATPRTRPDARPATSPRPVAPPRPWTTPAKKPQKRPRQHHAMRVTACATAALFLFAAATGATEIGLHGFKFFVFRGGGVGETSGTQTDQQFLAHQAAAAHHVAAPKGRHAIKSH